MKKMTVTNTIYKEINVWEVNVLEKTIYIRMRHKVQVRPDEKILINDITQLIAPEEIFMQLKTQCIHQVSREDRNIIVIDVMKVIAAITEKLPYADVQTIGPAQTIVEVVYKKKGVSFPLFLLIWLLLFFGAALAIMNFHEDVSMQSVHQELYTIITGKEEMKPLLFQIPYSVGLGLGMILFFNHIFKKRINEEPSPLEVEMFNYQLDLDNYVNMHENKESMKNLDDH
jgi:stage V sporulation protein AA